MWVFNLEETFLFPDLFEVLNYGVSFYLSHHNFKQKVVFANKIFTFELMMYLLNWQVLSNFATRQRTTMSPDVPPTNQLSSHERGRINPKCRLDVERCCRPSLIEKVKFEIEIEKKLILKCEEKIGSHIKKSRNKTYYVYKSKNNRAKRCGSHRDSRPLKKLPNTETVTKGGCCSP